MRVLFLARTLTVGGIEPHMMTLGTGLMSAGWEVAIASDGGRFAPAHGVEWFTSSGFRHYRIPFPAPDTGGLSRPIDAIRSAASLLSVISEFRPDVIHVHYRATSVYAYLARLALRIPFITTLHVIPIPANSLHRLVSFWGERTIAISGASRSFLIERFHLNPSRIRMVPNGVDESYYRPPTPSERCAAKRRFALDCGEPIVALIGRMSQPKGQDVLIQALAKLRRNGLRVTALLAGVSIEGGTEWRDEMVKLSANLGIADQIRFLGFTDTREVLWASDVLALPSRAEGFPLAVVEAMLTEVVPVRTPAAGAAEQIDDGRTGFLVPFDDSDALADKIETLIINPELRSEMARAARRKAVADFSARSMVAKTLAVYHEVTK